MGRLADEWNQFIQEYENQAVRFQLKVPKRPPHNYRTGTKISQFTDRYIFTRVFNDIVAQLYPLVTAYRTSTTNDSVRKTIGKDLQEHIRSFETVYKFGKLKGWMDEPPAYKTAKTAVTESLTTGEAFHILDHVSHRYHQLQLTKFFLSFAHDKEFRLILSQGVKQLEKETAMLQEIALKHQVQLPVRPPVSMEVPVEPETAEDSFMYQVILTGMQTAIDLHIRAVLETVRNDTLRAVFYQLFKDEVAMHERILKYGKTKGWIITVPIYAEPVS
ncbi:MAG: spore coat protein [Bacillota bacterium]|nr:spore coat protein [Bacillota bacterium]MDW7684273.1 spore coat protein [Bacillota bacterium]